MLTNEPIRSALRRYGSYRSKSEFQCPRIGDTLDYRHYFSYKLRISLESRGRLRPRVLPKAERERCPRAERYTPLPGSSMRAGITAGAGGAFPGLGQAGAGNARLVAQDLRPGSGGFSGSCALAASQEAWPGAERKGREPPGKSRGGTPTGERVPLDARRIRLMRTGTPCVCRRSASLYFVARMERSVIRGSAFKLRTLDPGLRFAPSGLRRLHKTRARIAPRERRRLSAPARSAGEGDHAKHGGGGMLSRGFFSDGGANCVAAPLPPPCGRSPSPAKQSFAGEDEKSACCVAISFTSHC